MIIGGMRAEESRAFSDDAGFHQFEDEENGVIWGSFEVFFMGEDDLKLTAPQEDFDLIDGYENPGWYWWACFPGYMPDGEPNGPFSTSTQAKDDANDF